MLKATNFSWLWVSWVSFAYWFFVFFNYDYFFFSYSCTVATTRTTTITSSNVSEGKGTLKTSYKLWSSEIRNFRRRKEWTTPKLVLLPTLGLGNTYTHTHTHTRFDCNTRFVPSDATPHICFPCTWVLRLASGLCIPMCFGACSHVMNFHCNNSRTRRRRK